MALNKDIKKIITTGSNIKKAYHQDEVIWQSVLDLSAPNLWEQGGFAVDNGDPVTASNRIRTKDYYLIESNSISISINSEYTVSVAFFRGDNSFISFSERGGSKVVTVPTGAVKFKPSMGRSDNGNIAVSEAVTANVQIQFL